MSDPDEVGQSQDQGETSEKDGVRIVGMAQPYQRGPFSITEVTFVDDRAGSEPQTHVVFERGDSAGVLIWVRDARQVVLVRQTRIATLQSAYGPRLVETVAGAMAAGEEAKACVIREALEETGYRLDPDKTFDVGMFYPSPGGSSERVHMFFAETRSADKVADGGGTGPEEVIQIEAVDYDAFIEGYERLAYADGKILIAAPALRRHVEQIEGGAG